MVTGISKEDREIDSIAKALVKALTRIEDCQHDPERILDSAKIEALHSLKGVHLALDALREYYLEEGKL